MAKAGYYDANFTPLMQATSDVVPVGGQGGECLVFWFRVWRAFGVRSGTSRPFDEPLEEWLELAPRWVCDIEDGTLTNVVYRYVWGAWRREGWCQG